MTDNKPFAMFFNASPRKNWNTYKMLEAAKAGAEEAGANTDTLATVFGASETLYACNTYQFTDYSRYDITLFDEAAKRAHRDAHFPIDLANARALGRRLVGKAAKDL